MGNAIGGLHAMMKDALQVHFEDGCCKPGAYCDEATTHVLPHLDRADITGPSAAELKARKPGTGHRPDAGSKAANQFGTFQVKPASPAQVRFLMTCLATRDLGRLTDIQASIVTRAKAALEAGKISKRLASSALGFVASLPVKDDAPQALVRGASDKQVGLIQRLAAEKDLANVSWDGETDGLSPQDASALIDRLFAAPKRPVEVKPEEEALESGIYRTEDGTIFKVYLSQGKTHLLAKRLEFDTDEETGKAVDPSWTYAGAAARFVKISQRMSLEEAKAFGQIYGVCCKCGAMLTDEDSIANGIGPVCGRSKGW